MTNDERATIYGKAMLELKECNDDIAALASYFSAYSQKLDRVHAMAKRFVYDPLGIAADRIPNSEHLKNDNLTLTRADFGDKVDEMVRLMNRAQELKTEVAKFQ
jgi:hypothetical protein